MDFINVGDSNIKWSSFPAQSDVKSVLMRQDGLVQTIGKTTEIISAIKVDGRNALERIQQVESELLGTFSHTTTLYHDTFAPIWHWDDIGGQTVEIAYSDVGVSGNVDFADGTSQVIAMSLSDPVFDLFSVEMILRLLPLTDAYQATLEVFHPNQQQLQTVLISVVNRELVYAGDDKMEDSWLVEVKFGDATRPYQYWIGAETRSLLKQSSTTEHGIILQFVR